MFNVLSTYVHTYIPYIRMLYDRRELNNNLEKEFKNATRVKFNETSNPSLGFYDFFLFLFSKNEAKKQKK